MKGVRRFRDRLKEDLKDRRFRKAFEEEELFARLAVEIAKLRQRQGLTQEALARRLHTSQQMISRIEDLRNRSLSLQTLSKLARVLHKRLDIRFV